jgi:small subunit ribosomal protein S6
LQLYETVIVFDPQLKTPEIEDYTKKFTDFIANHGGEIVQHEEWGKRRLAYEINRKQYGYYVLLRFNGSGQLVALLEREYKLNEMVIRYLTIKVDKKALQMEQKLEQKLAAEQEKAEEEAPAPETETKEEPADSVVAEVEADSVSEENTATAEEENREA